MLVLETPRLLLRRLEPGDLQPLFALYRDPEIRRGFPDGTRTLEQTRDELEWFLDGHPRHPELGLWATIEKRSGAFLGRCGLLPWTISGKLEVELAYLIDKARWGEGLATEASLGIVEHAREKLGLGRLDLPDHAGQRALGRRRAQGRHALRVGACGRIRVVPPYAMSLAAGNPRDAKS